MRESSSFSYFVVGHLPGQCNSRETRRGLEGEYPPTKCEKDPGIWSLGHRVSSRPAKRTMRAGRPCDKRRDAGQVVEERVGWKRPGSHSASNQSTLSWPWVGHLTTWQTMSPMAPPNLWVHPPEGDSLSDGQSTHQSLAGNRGPQGPKDRWIDC